ncbi:MAG TPA: MBOAT family O-acyltransferase, partial [Aggregatilineales bacterium]|nr:MBOAT family O-acyltransferase [Aggregatilineales bacterium]
MSITSLSFAGFSLAILIIYYLLPRRPQNILLLAASCIFLVSWAWEFAAVFAVLTLLNFGLSHQLQENNPRRKWSLRGGVILNIAALGYFKYSGYFIPQFLEGLDQLGIKTESGFLQILLPVGLSFYIVQVISYLLDINKKLIEPEDDLIDFALYMVYFPRVTSGPIERARDFLPKLKQARVVDDAVFTRSFALVLLGLVRKVAIADVLLSFIPEDVFITPKAFNAAELVIWLLVYAFALYNDFAGYTDIVRGISGFFGIELSRNFNTPYLARNFTEFWQRWHISLSDWLRDYIFTPLTRALLRRKYNSRHPITIIAPPLFTMLVSALWHNVAWNLILWGMLHGLYQVYERIRAVYFPSRPPQNHPAWRQVGAMILVFMLAVLAWVPFRMDLPVALDYWQGLFSPDRWQHFAPEFDLFHHFYVISAILI